jgi:hypothetical protein
VTVLADELQRAAAAAATYGEVSGVLAAEPTPGQRVFLVALGEGETRAWLVLDAQLRPVAERSHVRASASIIALCELAADLAGGGRLPDLEERVEEARTAGLEGRLVGAAEAIAALRQVVEPTPRLASPDLLDAIGSATRRLEHELGGELAPLASALQSHATVVDEFVDEVETRHRLPLR